MAAGTQIFVRNQEGKVFGPIEPSTVELLIDGGVLQGQLLVSTDGESYALPYRFPHLRDFFPRHLWGEGDRGDAQPATETPGPGASDGSLGATLFGSTPSEATATPAGSPTRPPVIQAGPARAPAVATAPAVPPVGAPPGMSPRRTPTGSIPAVPPSAPPGSPRDAPVLTAAPVEPVAPPPRSPSRPAAPRSPPAPPPEPARDEGWAAGLPFELAPPEGPRPPAHPTAPLSSTFNLLRADLAETNALKIYVQGARSSTTGLLFFDLPDRTATLYLRRGSPESAESNHPSDAIGPFLVAQRLATPEQLARAEREAIKFGNDVLAALFTHGAVNPGLVFPALAQRAADILLRAYLSPRGHFRFEALELPPSKVVPLGNRWGLLAEVIRRVPLAELKSRLMDVRERPLVRRSTGDALPDLRLTAQETRALSYFDGTRSLAHLAQSNAGEMDTILRVALLLRELDAVSFPDVAIRASPPAPATPPPAETAAPLGPPAPAAAPKLEPAAAAPPRRPTAPATPPATRTGTVIPALTPSGIATLPQADPPRIAPLTQPARPAPAKPPSELRELQARLERIQKENHFQVLGIPETADAAVVKAAYFKLAKLFHPDTVAADAPPDLARVKAEIFAAIGEANRVLADDTARARYRETLAEGGQAEIDVVAVLQAEQIFNKGTALVRARRFVEAVKVFDDAIAANPREGEFYAWRGYARFFTVPDKKVALVEALRDLKHALKLNERCAPAHYFIGQLHKLTGDAATALKHFQRCVALDPQNVNAQREIRLATQK